MRARDCHASPVLASSPFLDDELRTWSEGLRAWLARSAPSIEGEGGAHDDADATCKAWVRALAEGAWLDASVASPLSVRKLCLARETLAFESGLADFAFAMQGLGSGPITLFGSDEQRARYLPRVARGEAIAAFALSETEAGSDVAQLATRARADGDSFVLDGEKMWISNGGIADFYVVFARTGDAPGARGLSAFVVDADNEGLRIEERIDVIAPHPLARLRFEGCRVPASARVGAPGRGFHVAMATLDVFRSTVGAAALGFAKRALYETLAHTTQRELFGAALSELPVARADIADMALEIDASALLIYRAAFAKDRGAERVTREAAMAKLHATECAQRVIDRAVQLHGGRGVRVGETVEGLYREIRALRIYEGASAVQQQVIARSVLEEFRSRTSANGRARSRRRRR